MPAAAHRRVLVVEDNPDGNELLCAVLLRAGYSVEASFDGPEALRKVREFQPDVVLCDLSLPGGMSGFDLAQVLRSEASLARLVLIAISGHGRDEDRKLAIECGFDAHLTKPVHIREIEGVVAQLVMDRAAR